MPDRKSDYVFDTVSLSNFAMAGRLDLLVSRYGKLLKITREVLDEITDGVVAGYPQLHEVEELVSSNKFGVAKQRSSGAERDTYRELLRILGSGEASCIAYAKSCGAIVVTDDRTARECCIERNVKCTGTIGILKACCLSGGLSLDDADKALAFMINVGYYAPVQRISDLM
ncbi:MAG: hypothetical protein QGH15_03825 [Kiritimatiellia bacterium]|jgi:hypothetical protein|nr:hypothetical protein [Kiritimatiellia bacterium]